VIVVVLVGYIYDYINSLSIRMMDSNGGVKPRNQVMDKNMENLFSEQDTDIHERQVKKQGRSIN
jgi:hypothetical protein